MIKFVALLVIPILLVVEYVCTISINIPIKWQSMSLNIEFSKTENGILYEGDHFMFLLLIVCHKDLLFVIAVKESHKQIKTHP